MSNFEPELLITEENAQKKFRSDVTFIATLIALLIFTFFVTNVWLSVYKVQNVSMENTLFNDDIVLADKLAPIHRGDVVIFKYSADKDYVKRVIATEGDKIIFEQDKKTGEYCVYIIYKGEVIRQKLVEPYVKEGGFTEYRGKPSYVVGEDEIFVMGDNRLESYDSRDFGCVKKSQVKGVVHEVFIKMRGVTKFLFDNLGKNEEDN